MNFIRAGRRSEFPNIFFLFLAAILFLVGCAKLPLQSNGITLTLVNGTPSVISNVEVDYAGGSFGLPTLLPGKSVSRWVMPKESKPLKIAFQDSTGEHKATLLILHPEDQGRLELELRVEGHVQLINQSIVSTASAIR